MHRRLNLALDESFEVRGHSPFAATEHSEPEPDISVSRAVRRFEHPSEALLVIEVAQSSLAKDRGIKAGIYAEAGAREYWIVDIADDEITVEVHTKPSTDGFERMEKVRTGEVLRPVELPQVAIAVADIPWY